jgi:GNAT superfamily N-acetyltransferase
VILRRATPADAGVVAQISTTARHAAMPTIRWPHSAAEDRWWVANRLLPNEEVWVAEQDGEILGFLALHHDEHGDWVSQLYLRPGHWRQGFGTALLGHAKALRPAGLRLWCFQVNTRARAFYERHGFTIDHLTDGATNEEREPDILYIWRPT